MDLISRQAMLDAIFNDWDGMVVSLPTLIKCIPSAQSCPICGADMRETNATKEQSEQLDLMRAKAQMNIKQGDCMITIVI